jgi:hypothetical protein
VPDCQCLPPAASLPPLADAIVPVRSSAAVLVRRRLDAEPLSACPAGAYLCPSAAPPLCLHPPRPRRRAAVRLRPVPVPPCSIRRGRAAVPSGFAVRRAGPSRARRRRADHRASAVRRGAEQGFRCAFPKLVSCVEPYLIFFVLRHCI